MSVSDDETGHHPLTERMRYARQRDHDDHHKDIMTYLLRTNGLSLAETASRSLTSLFSLTDRMSPRLRGFKVSSSQEGCLTLSNDCVAGMEQLKNQHQEIRDQLRYWGWHLLWLWRGVDVTIYDKWQCFAFTGDWISNCGYRTCGNGHRQKVLPELFETYL